MSAVIPQSSEGVIRVVGQSLLQVADRTGKEFGSLEMQEWCSAFADCDPFELRQAFDNFVLRSPYAPSIAAIWQELERLRFGGVSGAWSLVQKTAVACSTHEGAPFIVFEHAGIHFAIDVIGGWEQTIRLVRDSQRVGFARRDFVQAFQDYRPTNPYPAGLGAFNGRNAVLMGHRARALEVYRNGVKPGAAFFPGAEALLPQVELLPWECPEVWPNELCSTHLAKPPGPPVRISVAWFEDTPAESIHAIGRADNAT